MGNESIMLPDYSKSILNLITSVLKYYGVKSQYNTLSKIDEYLKHKYKNIVLLIMDGMGENVLTNTSPNGILNNNKIDTITSVFPSTTTSAMTTFYSGLPPIEHGWLAWSMYFKEYGRAIDLLPCTDSYTGENFTCDTLSPYQILNYKTIYEKIIEACEDIKLYEVMPSYCLRRATNTLCADDINSLCDSIITLCKNTDDKFVMAYSDIPDNILHKYGCSSEEIKEFILNTEKSLCHMLKELGNTDTLLIISADHGHNDIKEIYNILDLNEIQECLIMPPFLESRLLSLYVKENMKEEFKNRFKKLFKDKYRLYTKEEFINSGLLGYGELHRKVEDFIGDYIAIAVSDTIIKLGTFISKEKKDKKSTHCGLTRNEMEVPLIVFDFKEKKS